MRSIFLKLWKSATNIQISVYFQLSIDSLSDSQEPQYWRHLRCIQCPKRNTRNDWSGVGVGGGGWGREGQESALKQKSLSFLNTYLKSKCSCLTILRANLSKMEGSGWTLCQFPLAKGDIEWGSKSMRVSSPILCSHGRWCKNLLSYVWATGMGSVQSQPFSHCKHLICKLKTKTEHSVLYHWKGLGK